MPILMSRFPDLISGFITTEFSSDLGWSILVTTSRPTHIPLFKYSETAPFASEVNCLYLPGHYAQSHPAFPAGPVPGFAVFSLLDHHLLVTWLSSTSQKSVKRVNVGFADNEHTLFFTSSYSFKDFKQVPSYKGPVPLTETASTIGK